MTHQGDKIRSHIARSLPAVAEPCVFIGWALVVSPINRGPGGSGRRRHLSGAINQPAAAPPESVKHGQRIGRGGVKVGRTIGLVWESGWG